MDPQLSPHQSWLRRLSLCAGVTLALSLPLHAGTPALSAKEPAAPPPEAVSWKDHTISPVANPFFHEDAVIRSEIRPVFVYHNIDDSFLGGGNAQLYALQLRYALTDRLAIIATQDGYFDINNDAIGQPEGWMDLALGLKYALIDDEAHQFILTPGFTFKIPTGDRDVFQGRGGGEWDLFVAAQKGFGDSTSPATWACACLTTAMKTAPWSITASWRTTTPAAGSSPLWPSMPTPWSMTATTSA